MPKATVDQVLAQGFRAEQFGKPENFAAPGTGMVWERLSQAALRVEALVGTALYAAATRTSTGDNQRNFNLLASAEMYLASAELWRAREAFADAELAVGRTAPEGQTIGSRYLTNADTYAEIANDLLAAVCGKRLLATSGIAVGFVETGPFAVSA